MQHDVFVISNKVEAGVGLVVVHRAVKLGRAEDDDSIGVDAVRKFDSLVNRNEVEGSHSNNLEDNTIGGK